MKLDYYFYACKTGVVNGDNIEKSGVSSVKRKTTPTEAFIAIAERVEKELKQNVCFTAFEIIKK